MRATSPRQVAIGLHALLDGLLQNWMLDPGGFALRAVGGQAIELHLAGLAVGIEFPMRSAAPHRPRDKAREMSLLSSVGFERKAPSAEWPRVAA